MTSHPLRRHHPRRRMIQYSVWWHLEHGRKPKQTHGVTGSPIKSGMTAEGVVKLKIKAPSQRNRTGVGLSRQSMNTYRLRPF